MTLPLHFTQHFSSTSHAVPVLGLLAGDDGINAARHRPRTAASFMRVVIMPAYDHLDLSRLAADQG